MARKPKQTDIEDAVDQSNGHAAPGKPGHNSQLTDDERRALTLHHKRAYEMADALVEKAKADRSAVAELAKHDLGKGVVAEIKEMIAFADTKKLKGALERTMRLARWLGLPIGAQPQMFEAVVDRTEEGKTAGMSGDECKPPQSLAHDAAQKWIQGWHDGQTVLMSAFKKKREPEATETPAPQPEAQPEPTNSAHDMDEPRVVQP